MTKVEDLAPMHLMAIYEFVFSVASRELKSDWRNQCYELIFSPLLASRGFWAARLGLSVFARMQIDLDDSAMFS